MSDALPGDGGLRRNLDGVPRPFPLPAWRESLDVGDQVDPVLGGKRSQCGMFEFVKPREIES